MPLPVIERRRDHRGSDTKSSGIARSFRGGPQTHPDGARASLQQAYYRLETIARHAFQTGNCRHAGQARERIPCARTCGVSRAGLFGVSDGD
jgi:hypothetical protein